MTLTAPPPELIATRQALHRLARYVITPRRQQVDGRERLEQLPGGFGTPVMSNDFQMRVDGADLVVTSSGSTVRETVTTLRRAGELVGVDPSDHTAKPDIPPMGDIDEVLTVDADAAAYLARWFEFASAALAALREDDASTDATETVLWSHHLDPSIEVLTDSQKASYGGSAGDGSVDQPYLYVGPWDSDSAPTSDFWNADGYVGAVLPVSELVDADDPLAIGVDFFRRGRDLLAGT